VSAVVEGPVPGVTRAAVDVRPPGRFEALRFPAYRLLFVSSTLMFFAINAQQIARGWLAIELTGTNAGLGGVFSRSACPCSY
jgi:hypothetical protein